ncbi:MAG: hypothetical protein VXX85_01280 [Candidatus Margulisiibacteriota bacterium]|nr:hypothetical protein [Candidatus Margulisiibacteriota bacterium]
MTAVIFIIQFIHYPQFLVVESSAWVKTAIHHQKVMGILVGPIMIVELFSWLILFNYLYETHLNLWVGVALIMICLWVSTFFIQVPYHKQLLNNKSEWVINKLIKTNWIRTALWSLKLLILITFF